MFGDNKSRHKGPFTRRRCLHTVVVVKQNGECSDVVVLLGKDGSKSPRTIKTLKKLSWKPSSDIFRITRYLKR